MYHALRGAGHDVRLFADNWDSALDLPIEQARALPRLGLGAGDTVIYHFAAGWPAGRALLAGFRCRRVVRDHNVTPARFFAGVSDEYTEVCARGEQEREGLARLGLDLYLSDSSYNRAAFVAAGAPPDRCRV